MSLVSPYDRLPTDFRLAWGPNPGIQTLALASIAREVLFGGAVSAGKSDFLIMDGLRYVGHPKHRGILFRREIDDTREVIDRTRDIYEKICRKAVWVESRYRWEFPNKATITMGHAQREVDIQAHKTFEYNHIGFDELTTFTRYQYVYMLSRNRAKSTGLPLRVRNGTNPDGEGHEWVFKRFVENREPGVVYRRKMVLPGPQGKPHEVETTLQYLPGTIWDNPHVANRDEYIAGLMSMGRQLAEALLYGRWDYFRGQMFPYGENAGLKRVPAGVKNVRHYVVRCSDYGYAHHNVVYWLVVYPDLSEAERKAIGAPKTGLWIEVASELTVQETAISGIASLIRAREDELKKLGLNLPARFSVIDPSTRGTQGTSGRSVIDLFQENGIWWELGNNDRQAGWGQLRLLLEAGSLGVWEGAAPFLLMTLPKLVRNPEKADDLKKGQRDHWADCLRYGVMAIWENMGVLVVPEREILTGRQDRVFPAIMQSLRGEGAASRFDLSQLLDGLG